MNKFGNWSINITIFAKNKQNTTNNDRRRVSM